MEATRPSSVIASYLGGSHAYGLDTPASDKDERFVYLNTEINNIIGLEKNEFYESKVKGEDVLGTEIRHFIYLLRKSGTAPIECLFATDFIYLCPAFKELVLDQKAKLVNPEKLYKSIKGYIFNERRLAIGERTGELGSKRKEALIKYGFSPKNFTNLIRLCFATKEFFRTGQFVVSFKGKEIHPWLMSVKTTPENWTKEKLLEAAEVHEAELDKEYENKKNPGHEYYFDEQYANEAIFKLYQPILTEIWEKLKKQSKESC